MPKKKIAKSDKQYAIPKDILREMASMCAQDTEKIYQRLIKIYMAQDDQFRFLIFGAFHYLAWSKMDGWKKEKRNEALKELKKIKKAAVTLNNLLPKIDFSKLPPAGSLEERMYNFLGSDDKVESCSGIYERNLGSWRTFQESLEKQIETYHSFEKFIKKGARNGRYNALVGLREFIYQIALLYMETTGKPFTVGIFARGKDGEPPEPITTGMRFAYKSLEAIYCASSSSHRFTSENFRNACAAVSKKLRKSQKP
jgi:hypothetical protein